MKCLAVFAAAVVGLATGCADKPVANNAVSGTRVPASVTARASTPEAPLQAPAVEAPKPSVMPTAANAAGPAGAIVNDRDPPDRIQVSR